MHAIVFVSVYTGLILLRRAPDHNRQDDVTLVSSLVFFFFLATHAAHFGAVQTLILTAA